MKAVADPSLGQQMAGPKRVGFEFAAQVSDHNADVVMLPERVCTPDIGQQLAVSDDLPGACRQQAQHLEFGRGKTHLTSLASELTGGKIQLTATKTKDWGLSLKPDTTRQCANAGQQLAHRKWLHNVVVGACIKGGNLVLLKVSCRQNQYRECASAA